LYENKIPRRENVEWILSKNQQILQKRSFLNEPMPLFKRLYDQNPLKSEIFISTFST
jgi:hypothetical protein